MFIKESPSGGTGRRGCIERRHKPGVDPVLRLARPARGSGLLPAQEPRPVQSAAGRRRGPGLHAGLGSPDRQLPRGDPISRRGQADLFQSGEVRRSTSAALSTLRRKDARTSDF